MTNMALKLLVAIICVTGFVAVAVVISDAVSEEGCGGG